MGGLFASAKSLTKQPVGPRQGSGKSFWPDRRHYWKFNPTKHPMCLPNLCLWSRRLAVRQSHQNIPNKLHKLNSDIFLLSLDSLLLHVCSTRVYCIPERRLRIESNRITSAFPVKEARCGNRSRVLLSVLNYKGTLKAHSKTKTPQPENSLACVLTQTTARSDQGELVASCLSQQESRNGHNVQRMSGMKF